MRCEISPLAEQDLREIGDYIATGNPLRAVSFIEELLDHSQRIALIPAGYTARDDIAPGLRSCPHKNYIIFYTTTGTVVRIERIIHGSRDVTGNPGDYF
jgi:plasmid stabilization system protein ParE